MDEADLICAVGARFDDRITGKLAEFAPRAKFIHIDIDPAEISKNVPAHIPIVGDAKNILPKLTRGDAIVTSDVGQHQMWCAQYYPFERPRRWINSGGLGTMGFGLPSAMGAKIARPDDTVVCLAGDGSLVMTCQELATCVTEEIPVK